VCVSQTVPATRGCGGGGSSGSLGGGNGVPEVTTTGQLQSEIGGEKGITKCKNFYCQRGGLLLGRTGDLVIVGSADVVECV